MKRWTVYKESLSIQGTLFEQSFKLMEKNVWYKGLLEPYCKGHKKLSRIVLTILGTH